MKSLAFFLLTIFSATAVSCPGTSETGALGATGGHGRNWVCGVTDGTLNQTPGVSIECGSFSFKGVSEATYELRYLVNPVVLF